MSKPVTSWRSFAGTHFMGMAVFLWQIVAGNNAGTCYVWRLQKSMRSQLDPNETALTTFEPLRMLSAHQGEYVLKCLISPDVRVLATTSSDRTVRRRNYTKG